MRSTLLAAAAATLLLAVAAAPKYAAAADAAYFNAEEAASIANLAPVGVVKSVTITGKGSVDKVINFDEVQALAAKEAHADIPGVRFLGCGASNAGKNPAGNAAPIDCDTRVEDEMDISFRVWTVGDKHYPIAYHLRAEVTVTPVGTGKKPQLVVGAEKLGYTKSNRVQGIVEDYIKDFLNHFGLQLALAKKGVSPVQ
jgi:hypothetical protein